MVKIKNGFDFLGWNFKVQKNGKFRCVPSGGNYKSFRKKVKFIVNNSNYGASLPSSLYPNNLNKLFFILIENVHPFPETLNY